MSKWLETSAAAAELGLTPRQLRALRLQMKAGKHYRVKNPRSARPEYLWKVEQCESLLNPVCMSKVTCKVEPGDRA